MTERGALRRTGLELVISITSLLISVAVAVAQLVQWRRAGAVVKCEVSNSRDRVVVTARNVGRGACELTGFGFMFGCLEYPWISATATRYWPGAGEWTNSQLDSPFPLTLNGQASRSWYVPTDELAAAHDSFTEAADPVRGYVTLATGEQIASRRAFQLAPMAPRT